MYPDQFAMAQKMQEKAKMEARVQLLRAKGYKVDKVKDNSVTAFISEYEYRLPLGKISIDDFERRVKKLATQESGDFMDPYQV